jgi:hypothetical protein
MYESKHPTRSVGALLLHPSLLQEAHHQLVVGAAHKLGVPESDQHIAHETYFSVFKWKLSRDCVNITCARDHRHEGEVDTKGPWDPPEMEVTEIIYRKSIEFCSCIWCDPLQKGGF